ncbi:hypothetical protein A8C32_07505 [Flavivirga aquatica]|uniref:Uncharacterized protein n=1 Tax=Flavivirga aquatica TaxID=1849968 RepID=A0A1E5SIX0_9FLAO|nr:hypothetical protein [Flavivirga aquatica]OEJ99016.1 hypothetical protein A8C32_07505 [Flavivirga aquatica]
MKNKLLVIILIFTSLSINAEDLLSLPKNLKPEDRICFAIYTVHENIVKLTAQFYPIKNFELFEAVLEIEENGKWIEKVTAPIRYPGYTSLFRIEDRTTDWENTEMKTVLSQTLSTIVNNYTGKHDREIIADFDTNGWQQTGRNKVLAVIRNCGRKYAF